MIRSHAHEEMEISAHCAHERFRNGCVGTQVRPLVVTGTDATTRALVSAEVHRLAMHRPGRHGPTRTVSLIVTPYSTDDRSTTKAAESVGCTILMFLPGRNFARVVPSGTTSVATGRGHASAPWRGAPTQPRGHERRETPNVWKKSASAEIKKGEEQQRTVLHLLQRRRPQEVHSRACGMSEARADEEGGQKQPPIDVDIIPPEVCAWLYAIAETEVEMKDRVSIVKEILRRIAQCRITNQVYIEELMHTLQKMYANPALVDGLPPFVMLDRSPAAAEDAAPLLAHCHEKSKRGASLVLYHMALLTIAKKKTIQRVTSNRARETTMGVVHAIMVVYADECTFPITSDWYLHVLLRMHLPSWGIQLETEGAYEALSQVLGVHSNKFGRTYLDGQPVQFIRGKNPEEDDVVMFVVMVTLLAEVCGEVALTLSYNRDVAINTFDVPKPFVFCDYPVPGLLTDAYGYVYKGVIHVANGRGVGNGAMEWLEACKEAKVAKEVTEFLEGNAPPSNTLHKYAV